MAAQPNVRMDENADAMPQPLWHEGRVGGGLRPLRQDKYAIQSMRNRPRVSRRVFPVALMTRRPAPSTRGAVYFDHRLGAGVFKHPART
jgi:hypothetical protein